MKTLPTLLLITFFMSSFSVIVAQEKDSPIFDYAEAEISNTATIPDYDSKSNKIKISGTIYESDGVTPAKDVILYIEQADESGDFEVKSNKDKRYVHHRAWVKTNDNGEYTFYTFIPGTDVRNKELRYIHTLIKAPNQPEYDINGFLFDNDPSLTKRCRKKIERNNVNNILMLEEKDGMYVATRDITLESELPLAKK